jgi:hypothetical protein
MLEEHRHNSVQDHEKVETKQEREELCLQLNTMPGGIGSTFIEDDRMGGTVSSSPTYLDWFKQFMRGCHKRMGDVWISDRALTMRELLCSQTLLEDDWELFKGDIRTEG